MLEWIKGQPSERKLRLCASAWARWIVQHPEATPRMVPYRPWFADPAWTPQLDAADQFADGRITPETLRAARTVGGGPYNIFREACRAAHFSMDSVCGSLRYFQAEFGAPPDRVPCDLLRDIINPFARAAIPDTWLRWNEGTIPKLAGAIYDDRAFDRLPILADAFEEAGGTDAAILDHCRGPGPHVRGCWVVDLILGKA
jgi:hypothetical protein